MGVGGQRHAPAALPPRKRPGTRCIGGWVGPRAGLDGCGKISPPPGFEPRTVQPVASRYPGPSHAPEPFTSPIGNLDPINFNLFVSLKTGVPKFPRNVEAISKF